MIVARPDQLQGAGDLRVGEGLDHRRREADGARFVIDMRAIGPVPAYGAYRRATVSAT